jgi:CHASE2 domain-containing sensor protein
LTLAAFSGPGGHVVGTECLSDLTTSALVLRRSSAPFRFVNLEEDPDGVIRRGRLFFRDEAGGRYPSWAARAASMLPPTRPEPAEPAFRIDHRINGNLYERIPWLALPAILEKEPQRFRGRLVLVGGDFLSWGDDDHRVPVSLGSIGAVSSLTLQALQVDTIIAGLPVREAPRRPILLLAALAAGGAALIVLLRRCAVRVAAGLLAAGSLYTAISLPVFLKTGLLLPITSPCVVVALGLAATLALRRFLPPIPTSRR